MTGPLRRLFIVTSLLLWLPSVVSASTDTQLQKGLDLLKSGRTTEAIAALHDAARSLPDPALLAPVLGEAYLQSGMQQLDNGGDAGAREAFAEAKRYLPDDPRPWQWMAICWLHAGQPAPAVAELGEAIVLAGERPELLILLGRAEYAAGELLQAEAVWERAAELGSDSEVAPLLEKVRREFRVEQTMQRDLAGPFSIAYAPGVSKPLAAIVLDTLQGAYDDLGSDLGFYPEAEIPVLLYAREDFAAVTHSPQWAGAVYDGKIRVPLGGVAEMSAPLRGLLYHEYAHVLVRFLGRGRVPVWLNEGLAEVAGRQYFSPPAVPASTGRPLTAAALDRPFTELPAELVPLAYQASYERVNHLVERCGWSPLGELLQRLGSGEPWEIAVANAYAPCGMDWPRLQAELAAGHIP
jgi:tetratricopeptide (TPR) repeat protein